MNETLRRRLERKLDEAQVGDWGGRAPLHFEFSELSGGDCPGVALTAALKVLAMGRDGKRIAVHVTRTTMLSTPEEVDDWLAETLSQTLMKHPDWPA